MATSESQKSAFKKYESKRVLKRVSFNIENDDERKLLEYANSIDFSATVKEMLKYHLQSKK